MFATDMFVTYCVHVECIVLYYKICSSIDHRRATHSLEIGRHTATITKSVLIIQCTKRSVRIILLLQGRVIIIFINAQVVRVSARLKDSVAQRTISIAGS